MKKKTFLQKGFDRSVENLAIQPYCAMWIFHQPKMPKAISEKRAQNEKCTQNNATDQQR